MRRPETTVSTDPREYPDFERDNSWGQAMQLLESSDGSAIVVSAGDWVQITVQFTKLSMHVAVEPADSPVAAAGRRLQHESSGCGAEATGPSRCFVQTIVLIMR